MKQIKAQIDETASDFDREKLQERLAKLAGGVAVLKVGAATEVELKEKKLRVEDALSATRAAVEEGIVPGGGVALIRCQRVLDELAGDLDGDERTGVLILRKALEEPLTHDRRQRRHRRHGRRRRRAQEQRPRTSATTPANDVYGNMIERGVIDPVKVTRTALENAASIATMILTTESLVTDIPSEAPAMPMGGPPPMDY